MIDLNQPGETQKRSKPNHSTYAPKQAGRLTINFSGLEKWSG